MGCCSSTDRSHTNNISNNKQDENDNDATGAGRRSSSRPTPHLLQVATMSITSSTESFSNDINDMPSPLVVPPTLDRSDQLAYTTLLSPSCEDFEGSHLPGSVEYSPLPDSLSHPPHAGTQRFRSDSPPPSFFELTPTVDGGGGLIGEGTMTATSSSDPSGSTSQVVVAQDIVKGVDSCGNKLVNEYAILAHLGEGAYGKVKLAIDTKTETPVAIKILNKAKLRKQVVMQRALSRRQQQQQSAEESCPNSIETIHPEEEPTDTQVMMNRIHREIEIMRRYRHPNLARLYAVIDNQHHDKLYLIMKYMSGGTIGTTPPLSEYDPTTTSLRWTGGWDLFRDLFFKCPSWVGLPA